MTNETYLLLTAVSTLFIFIGAGGLVTAVYRWFRIWRNPQTRNPRLAFVLMLKNIPWLSGFLVVLVWRFVRLYTGQLTMENSSPSATWTGLLLWLVFMFGGILTGGVSMGWFTPKEQRPITDYEGE